MPGARAGAEPADRARVYHRQQFRCAAAGFALSVVYLAMWLPTGASVAPPRQLPDLTPGAGVRGSPHAGRAGVGVPDPEPAAPLAPRILAAASLRPAAPVAGALDLGPGQGRPRRRAPRRARRRGRLRAPRRDAVVVALGS